MPRSTTAQQPPPSVGRHLRRGRSRARRAAIDQVVNGSSTYSIAPANDLPDRFEHCRPKRPDKPGVSVSDPVGFYFICGSSFSFHFRAQFSLSVVHPTATPNSKHQYSPPAARSDSMNALPRLDIIAHQRRKDPISGDRILNLHTKSDRRTPGPSSVSQSCRRVHFTQAPYSAAC